MSLLRPMTRELGYARSLAVGMWEHYYKAEAPNWEPLPDLLGLLTQIDNMVAGLPRAAGGWWLALPPGHPPRSWEKAGVKSQNPRRCGRQLEQNRKVSHMKRAMERADFERVADVLYGFLSEQFGKEKELEPVVLLLKLSTDHKVSDFVPLPVGHLFREELGTFGKDAAAMLLDEACRLPSIDMAVLISEVWVAHAGPDGGLPKGATCVADVPDKTEAVMLVLRTADFATYVRFPIDRVAHTLVKTPIEWETKFESRFAPQGQGMPQ